MISNSRDALRMTNSITPDTSLSVALRYSTLQAIETKGSMGFRAFEGNGQLT
jgi:hypothetical protein